MKKLLVLLTVTLFLWSCEEVTVPQPISSGPTTDYYHQGQGQSGEDVPYFNWTSCNPQEPVYLGKNEVGNGVYDYLFKVYLGGSLVDPNPLYMSTFSIPHVGPGGRLIYDNVANDATYTITGIDNQYLYYTIRSIKGSVLKYNIAKYYNGAWRWFLRRDSGYSLSYDDGVNNIYSFKTE